jgi:uncharacterized protein (TIGR00369 family)
MGREKKRAQAALEALSDDELPIAAAALEALAASRGKLGGAFTRLLGIEVLTMEPGLCICAFDVDEWLWNKVRVVHGGATYSLVDFSMACATVSVLKSGQRTTTLDVQIRYLSPVRRGRLTAETRVRHQGNRVVILDSQVRDRNGGLVATASGAFYVVDKSREGRS